MGDQEYYIYDARWATTGSGFSWNEGVSTDITYSTSGRNPVLDYIHRKEFSVNLRASFLNKLITTDITFFNTDMSGYISQDPTTFPSHLQNVVGGGSFKPALNNNIYNRKGIDFSITAHKKFGEVDATLGVVGTYLYTNVKKYEIGRAHV